MPIHECPYCAILYCRECPGCGRLEPEPECTIRREMQPDDPAEYCPDFDGIEAIDY